MQNSTHRCVQSQLICGNIQYAVLIKLSQRNSQKLIFVSGAFYGTKLTAERRQRYREFSLK
jgi:hypothetical protein